MTSFLSSKSAFSKSGQQPEQITDSNRVPGGSNLFQLQELMQEFKQD
jgi:hypothetical protein